jgi:transketolase
MSCPNTAIRRTILKMVSRNGASHVGAALSIVEILNCVYSQVDRARIASGRADRDRVLLSKGHATAALYAVLGHQGLLPMEDLNSYFANGSVLAGHASHLVPSVEHSTGALGHGLPVGLGIALGTRSRGLTSRTYVVVGDGELHEGSNWEAIMYAGHASVSNLCLLIDKNERSQMGNTSDACSIDPLPDKLVAFNWETFVVGDGHDETAILAALEAAKSHARPSAIVCPTTKGKGVSFMEGDNLWHYRSPAGDDLARALAELEEGEHR